MSTCFKLMVVAVVVILVTFAMVRIIACALKYTISRTPGIVDLLRRLTDLHKVVDVWDYFQKLKCVNEKVQGDNV